ncbi:MAG: hypothetical protein DMG41_04660 [Acidobacteria bacterium]|nr:MAG: hypothetical protein AUH13_12790 [Acidobacteria bacterium 13_2_20CM_58_27]PYT69480.1 MAG: hypothetical protein DMG42_21680 [Acidobacteriota bacterium]PYT90317.1 MAG: hypothetical protein DMG41_04660 [Acidobacteriota bacterium]
MAFPSSLELPRAANWIAHSYSSASLYLFQADGMEPAFTAAGQADSPTEALAVAVAGAMR